MGCKQCKSILPCPSRIEHPGKSTVKVQQPKSNNDSKQNASICSTTSNCNVMHNDSIVRLSKKPFNEQKNDNVELGKQNDQLIPTAKINKPEISEHDSDCSHFSDSSSIPRRSLTDLPTEIIYEILDRLDACTIYTSLYNICTSLNTIIENYQGYNLNLKSVSKLCYYRVCSIIRPEQVRSLTLSDANDSVGQVKIFLEQFQMISFSHLRSLTLFEIDDNDQVIEILSCVTDNLSTLIIENSHEDYNDLVFDLLMGIIERHNLRKLHLELNDEHMLGLSEIWPSHCSIRHLQLSSLCSISFFRMILQSCADLETLKIEDIDFSEEWNNDDSNDNDFNQQQILPVPISLSLISLSINSLQNEMEKFEWLLPQLKSLKYLKIITEFASQIESILDGSRWEQILVPIKKFDVFFNIDLQRNNWNAKDCLGKFKTPFWVLKQWNVILEQNSTIITLYTLPYCHSLYHYHTVTFYRSSNRAACLANSIQNIRQLIIDVPSFDTTSRATERICSISSVSHLEINGSWKTELRTSMIISFICLSNITDLTIHDRIQTSIFKSFICLLPNLHSLTTTTALLNNLNAFHFQYGKCLHSLSVIQNNLYDQRFINIEPFCSMFPRVERLNIPVENCNDCQYVIQQHGDNLISGTFQIVNQNRNNGNENDFGPQNPLISWIENVLKCHQYRLRGNQIDLWLK